MRRLVALSISAAVLGGCADAITITGGPTGSHSNVGGYVDHATASNLSPAGYAAASGFLPRNEAGASGALPVVMLDNPFPPPAVLAALQRNNTRPLHFTADPPASLSSGYRLVLTFDESPSRGCQQPLATSARPAGAAPTTQRVYGAFCYGPTQISGATASSPQAVSADDPRLGRMMGDLLAALMPYSPPSGR